MISENKQPLSQASRTTTNNINRGDGSHRERLARTTNQSTLNPGWERRRLEREFTSTEMPPKSNNNTDVLCARRLPLQPEANMGNAQSPISLGTWAIDRVPDNNGIAFGVCILRLGLVTLHQRGAAFAIKGLRGSNTIGIGKRALRGERPGLL